ncbi:MAG: RNA polymerase sigma factor [Candidatus Aminicenantes bacterium]|nr:MAG: RNA polymerase sigma factor [Candidatus Aminicenantes bacterium]
MALTAGSFIRQGPKPAAALSTTPAEDRDTFLRYVLPVKKPLYNFVRKALNFSPDTDDIFQETLLKGFRYFHSFDHRKNFKTWIFTIAHNLLKDAFQEKKRRLWPMPLEEVEEIAVDDSQTNTPHEVQEIYAAAAQLKPRQREVFFLYYYNEFSVSEITEITGLTRTNVKFMLHQARKAIKKAMEVQA